MSAKTYIYFVSLISRDNRPLHIQSSLDYEKQPTEPTQPVPKKESAPVVIPEDKKTTSQNKDVESSIPGPQERRESFMDEAQSNEFLKYNFLSHMALDVFLSSYHQKNPEQEYELLFVQDGISVFGLVTNSGLKIVVGASGQDLVGNDMKLVFKGIQRAYIRLVCNPFQDLDGKGLISSPRFVRTIDEIIQKWNARESRDEQ